MMKSARGVADQVLVSAAHFIIGLSVARSGDPAALGLFSLAFLIISAVGDLHRAVIWLPMSQEADSTQYRTARRAAVLMGSITAAAATIALALLVTAGLTDWAWIAACIAVVLPLLFVHEIQRRIQFALLEAGRALGADLAYAAVAIVALLLFPQPSTGSVGLVVRAFAALTVGSAAGAATGALLLRHLPVRSWSVADLLRRYAPASRAYSMNAVLVLGSQRLSMVVIAGALSIEALGRVEAARLLTAPLMVMATGYASIAIPSVSHTLRQGGSAAVGTLLARMRVLGITAAAAYGAVLLIGGESLSRFVFGHTFEGSLSLGLLYCGIAAGSLIATTLVVPLGITEPEAIPRARLPGVALVVAGSFPAALLLGEHGVLALVVIESALTAALLQRGVDRLYRRTA